MTGWRRQARDRLAAGEPAVLVRVVLVRGSAPRDVGTAMLVGRGDTLGTIGGGQLEYRCVRIAADVLADEPAEPFSRRFPLGADCGQCCGGVVEVAFEDLRRLSRPLERLDEMLPPPGFDIAVFGAGHVGSACVSVLSMLDAAIRWIDSRPDLFPGRLPDNVQALSSGDPAREVAALPPGASLLVMTHSHPLDLDICAAALARDDLAFLGLIGSRSKRRRFEKRLLSQGIAGLDRLVCPIGIDGVGGKEPAEIAVGVAAQLLRLRNAGESCASASLKAL